MLDPRAAAFEDVAESGIDAGGDRCKLTARGDTGAALDNFKESIR